jgi:hypothetical protein
MKLTDFQMDGLKAMIAAMVAGLFFLFAPVLYFAIKGDEVGVAASLVAIFMLFLGIVVMGAVAVGSAWTRSTMRDGAMLALGSEDRNDRSDIAKMNNMTKLFSAGAQAARGLKPGENTALPLPSQNFSGWLTDVDIPAVDLLESGEDHWG